MSSWTRENITQDVGKDAPICVVDLVDLKKESHKLGHQDGPMNTQMIMITPKRTNFLPHPLFRMYFMTPLD